VLDIRRIDHVSVAVPELAAAVELLTGLFGFAAPGQPQPWPGFRGVTLQVPGRSRLRWEVLEPDGPDSHLHRFLDGPAGPGLHHVTCYLPDVPAAALELRRLDVEPWGYEPPRAHVADPQRSSSRGVVYLHPRGGGQGTLFQLLGGPPREDPPHDAPAGSLGIVAVDHVAHAGPDADALVGWYARVLGFRTVARFAADEGVPFERRLLAVPSGQLRWEVLAPPRSPVEGGAAPPMSAPLAAAGPLAHFLAQRGPGLHHVAFEVRDWEAARNACERWGVELFGEREGVSARGRWAEAFLRPADVFGVLVQLGWQERPGAWA
jgi:catechol 2,3-dioxygenase-like lactoylglutathione lyase family enzyme